MAKILVFVHRRASGVHDDVTQRRTAVFVAVKDAERFILGIRQAVSADKAAGEGDHSGLLGKGDNK